MKALTALIFSAGVLAFPAVATARVFDLNSEKFASYLIFSYGKSKIDDGAMVNESTAAGYSDGVKTNTGGEFGFIYATEIINWRFGIEILKPSTLAAVQGQNAAGSQLYLVRSDLNAVIPKVGLEINLYKGSWFRVMAFGTYGSGNVEVANDYTSVTIAPTTDFSVKYKGSGAVKSGGLSFEMAAFDTSSIVLELGYRDFSVTNLTYAKAVTAFGGTARAVGDAVNWTDGKAREIDFSGAYAAFGARFWLF